MWLGDSAPGFESTSCRNPAYQAGARYEIPGMPSTRHEPCGPHGYAAYARLAEEVRATACCGSSQASDEEDAYEGDDTFTDDVFATQKAIAERRYMGGSRKHGRDGASASAADGAIAALSSPSASKHRGGHKIRRHHARTGANGSAQSTNIQGSLYDAASMWNVFTEFKQLPLPPGGLAAPVSSRKSLEPASWRHRDAIMQLLTVSNGLDESGSPTLWFQNVVPAHDLCMSFGFYEGVDVLVVRCLQQHATGMRMWVRNQATAVKGVMSHAYDGPDADASRWTDDLFLPQLLDELFLFPILRDDGASVDRALHAFVNVQHAWNALAAHVFAGDSSSAARRYAMLPLFRALHAASLGFHARGSSALLSVQPQAIVAALFMKLGFQQVSFVLQHLVAFVRHEAVDDHPYNTLLACVSPALTRQLALHLQTSARYARHLHPHTHSCAVFQCAAFQRALAHTRARPVPLLPSLCAGLLALPTNC
ncbi:MAG: hypothetical protein EOO65_03225 [Methanosarcinales archaeon]|nr:MAG: hypothetical protein EOO65_03225 [Methanosarcinales archaeon]